MRLYLIALQFLTIIPLPFSLRYEEKDLGRSMVFFPLVGLTLGAILVGIKYLFSPFLPDNIVDLLLVVALSVITGILHLDGLADVCDGIAARGDRERFLAVMKDSRTGAAGAIGLILVLLLKYQALSQIPEEIKTQALFCFPMLARFTQVQMAVGSRRARSDGLGTTFVEERGRWRLLIAGVTTLVLSSLFFGFAGAGLFASAFALTWGLKAWFHRKAGGVTGDIIGFTSELNEVLCMLLIVALAGSQTYFV